MARMRIFGVLIENGQMALAAIYISSQIKKLRTKKIIFSSLSIEDPLLAQIRNRSLI